MLREINDKVITIELSLVGTTPVRSTLVKGATYYVLIDTGTKPQCEQILKYLNEVVGDLSKIRLILNTHGHHDHIGSNNQIKTATGALLGCPQGAVPWIEDFEEHYKRFCLVDTDILPDQQWMRDECFSLLDAETHVDLTLREGDYVKLDDTVKLRILELPGHMIDEIGFIEESTNTLIIGDAIICNDIVDIGPLFHGYQDAKSYKATLSRLNKLASSNRYKAIVSGHLPITDYTGLLEFIKTAEAFFDNVERSIISTIGDSDAPISGKEVWEKLCDRWGYRKEFRGLSMVKSHVELLRDQGIIGGDWKHGYFIRDQVK